MSSAQSIPYDQAFPIPYKRWSKQFLIIAILFIVSPLSLYFGRVSSLVVVCGSLAMAAVMLLLQLSVEKVPTLFDTPSALFLAYMTVNCGLSILFLHHGANNALADLVPVAEVYVAFQLAKRSTFTSESIARILKWVLLLATLRATWQIIAVITGLHIMPPIYAPGVDAPVYAIGGFTYERPIDPICGVAFTLAAICFLYRIARRLSFFALLSSGIVLFLGMTRSEWIACFVALTIAMFYAGKLRGTIKIFAGIAVITAAIFLTFPTLYESTVDRLITHTIEQAEASDVMVASLRITEFGVAIGEFKTSPLFGHGLGSWFGTQVMYGNSDTYVFVQLHNSYLNLLANAGLAGFALLGWIMIRVRRTTRIAVQENPGARMLVSLALATLAWYGVFMAFQPLYSTYHIPVLFGSLWGMTIRSLSVQSRSGEKRNGPVFPSLGLYSSSTL
jgi:O-antigen ligase